MKILIALTLAVFSTAPTTFAHCAPAHTAIFQDEKGVPIKDPHLTEWPAISKSQNKALKKAMAQLRKAASPGMAKLGRTALIDLGDVAGPALLKALSKERNEDGRERIVDVLYLVTGELHTRLLAAEFTSKSEHVRLFCLERASGFPDEGIRSAAQKAFTAAKARAGGKKEIKNELYLVSLALVSSGSLESLAQLHERALTKWGKSGRAIRSAIEAVRGEKATKIIMDEVEAGDRKSTVAGLRMLSGCGDLKTAKAFAGGFLDSDDNSIRVAAINALRGIIDGDKPLERLPVFEAVELATKWKARL